jgi:hypothetical protein
MFDPACPESAPSTTPSLIVGAVALVAAFCAVTLAADGAHRTAAQTAMFARPGDMAYASGQRTVTSEAQPCAGPAAAR